MGNNTDVKTRTTDETKKKAVAEIYRSLRRNGVTLFSQDPIGKGSFSTVCLGYCKNREEQVAVKIIYVGVRNEYVKRFLPRELSLVPVLNHDNIVKVYQIARTPFYTAIVQEYGAKGDLLQLIKRKKRLDEPEGRFLFRQLIEAIRYLEGLYIVHRDLKCENIFLDSYNNIKLGDFGFARVLRPYEISGTHCGSKAYVAIEVLRGLYYAGNGADIWSAGVVLFIMLTGCMPFDTSDTKKMMRRQLRHSIVFPEDTAGDDAQELIRTMLHPRTELRATSQEIVASKWLKGCRYFMRGRVPSISSCSSVSSTTVTSLESQEETSVLVSSRTTLPG